MELGLKLAIGIGTVSVNVAYLQQRVLQLEALKNINHRRQTFSFEEAVAAVMEVSLKVANPISVLILPEEFKTDNLSRQPNLNIR